MTPWTRSDAPERSADLRLGEPHRVDDERELPPPRLLARHEDGRSGALDGPFLRHDVPDLDRLGAARREVGDARAGGLLVLQPDELPLRREVQPEIDRREERSGCPDARSERVALGPRRKLQRPRIAAHVEDARDAGTEVRTEEAFRVLAQVGLDLLVGKPRSDVEGVRASVGPPGLTEVDVGVDETRRDPQAFQVRHSGSLGERTRGARSGAGDSASADEDDGVPNRRAAGAVHERRPDVGLRRRWRCCRGGGSECGR